MRRLHWARGWITVLIFFIFLFFQQFDVVLLAPVITQILSTFNISNPQFQIVLMSGLWIGGIFFLVWGWACDRFSRKQLLIYACLIWGFTSLLIGMSPTFATFSVSYVISAIDNASYPGVFSMVSDYFTPKHRGKIYGLLHAAQPLAYLGGTFLASLLSSQINWRWVMLSSGGVAFLTSVLFTLGIKEPRRGQSEPEMQGIEASGKYILNRSGVKALFKQRGLILLFFTGFFAIMPWTIITSWMSTYLQSAYYLPIDKIYQILLPALAALALGYPLGGLAGDMIFKNWKRGRIITSMSGISLSIVFLVFSFHATHPIGGRFTLLLMLTGFFMALERPNCIAMVFDITMPELRSTAMAIMMVFQLMGSILGTSIVNRLIPMIGLGQAILWNCVGAWGISILLLIGSMWFIPGEIEVLRKQMAYRSCLEGRLHSQDSV